MRSRAAKPANISPLILPVNHYSFGFFSVTIASRPRSCKWHSGSAFLSGCGWWMGGFK